MSDRHPDADDPAFRDADPVLLGIDARLERLVAEDGESDDDDDDDDDDGLAGVPAVPS